ncbi:MAG: hypothetical protein ABI877_19920 [Gemmatimonadaceae bacterium]
MPSSTEFFQELQKANVHLSSINGDLNEFRDVMEFNTAQLIAIGNFTNGALFHQIKQLDTVICLLKQISDHTCRLLNESHTQTGLQTEIASDTETLSALYALTHAEAALVHQREAALRAQIEACCPPPKGTDPACRPEKCAEPGDFDKGPVILKPAPKKKSRDS